MSYRVLVLVGSLRQGSYNRLLARALASVAPSELAFETVELADLPFYDQELERDGVPASWQRLWRQMDGAHGLLFVTPEHHGATPALLLNALEIASLPDGSNRLADKPAAVLSASDGAQLGFGAHQHLRETLRALQVPVLPFPAGAEACFDEAGALKSEAGQHFLRTVGESFAAWIRASGRPAD